MGKTRICGCLKEIIWKFVSVGSMIKIYKNGVRPVLIYGPGTKVSSRDENNENGTWQNIKR